MANWSGWWEQRGLGRQTMHDLVLHVDPNRTVTGGGNDCVGPFTFRGQFRPDGKVLLVKQYIGRHQVLYRGRNSGEGIFGTWRIPGFHTGKFALRPLADAHRGYEKIQMLWNRAGLPWS